MYSSYNAAVLSLVVHKVSTSDKMPKCVSAYLLPIS